MRFWLDRTATLLPTQSAHNTSSTLGSRPCLSISEMMVRMCCSLMTFRASGESTSTQCNTSSTPGGTTIHFQYTPHGLTETVLCSNADKQRILLIEVINYILSWCCRRESSFLRIGWIYCQINYEILNKEDTIVLFRLDLSSQLNGHGIM